MDDTDPILDAVAALRTAGVAAAPTGEELDRWQIGQALGDMRTVQVHERAIAWLDELIATKRRHAAEDEAERRRGESVAET